MSTPLKPYLLGHSDRERRRLELQGKILLRPTEQLLRDAGICGGLRVLDIGCGVGDVTEIVSKLVGPGGHVTGVDFDAGGLEVARSRTKEDARGRVDYVEADLATYETAERFDAVVGRLILLHTPDPLALIRRVLTFLRPGGVLVFQEYDLSFRVPGYPSAPLAERVMDCFVQLQMRVKNPGMRLLNWFVEAGLPSPECRACLMMEGGPDSLYYEWRAETLRSALPRLEEQGIARPGEFNLDTLASELREEAIASHAPLVAMPLIGAFSRKHAE